MNEHEWKANYFDSVLETGYAGFWDWNIVDNTEYLSTGFKMMFGYTHDDMESSPEAWQKIAFESDLPSLFASFEKHVLSRGEVQFSEMVRFHHKNGNTVFVICSGAVVEWNEQGEPLRAIGTHVDITQAIEHVRLAERETFSFLDFLQKDAPLMMALGDPETCKIIWISNFMAKNLGYTPSELIDQPYTQLHFEEDKELVERQLKNEGAVQDETVRLRHKSGKPILAYVRAKDVQLRGKRHHLGIFLNRNEINKAKEAFRLADKRHFESLTYQSNELLTQTDTDDIIRFVSPNCEVLTGYKEEELIGKRIMDFVGEEDLAQVRKLITLHKEKRTYSYGFKARWKHKDEKTPLYLESKVTRMSSYDDGTGQPTENAVTRNFVITDEVLAKKERNTLSEMKGEFIAIASHQLRTPLASLNIDLDILDMELAEEESPENMDSCKEKVRNRLQKIRNSVDRMTNLTSDLLIYGKAQNGKLQPSLGSYDLMEVLINQLNASFNSYTDFRLEFPAQEKLMVQIDPIFLGHILDNVIDNGIKYHPHKKLPHLIVGKEPEHILLQIKDEGIGIPQNEILKVQESFARGSNTNGTPGTGLGLAIVKIFCELCNIQFSIHSVQNEGTTVALKIPTV